MDEATGRGSDQIARTLERAIMAREFEGRLPAERELARRFGVSRSTLREGVTLLVARGLLTRRQGAGTFINDQTDQRMAEIWSDMAQRHPRLQEDLIEFRSMIECRSAELAALRHDADDRERLLRAGEAVDAAYSGNDRGAQIASDVGFHRAIADATHNPVFSYLMASLLKLLHEHVQLSIAGLEPNSDVAVQLRKQHRDVIDAILAREAIGAARATERHIEFVRVCLNDGS